MNPLAATPPSPPPPPRPPDIADVAKVAGPLGLVGSVAATIAAPPAFESIDLGDAITEETFRAKADPIATGIDCVNAQLGGGFYAGELTMLQSGPGGGKTTLMLLLTCQGVAPDPSRAGLYVTTEMSAEELQARRACQVLDARGIHATWRSVLRGHVPLELVQQATRGTRVRVLRLRPSQEAVKKIEEEAARLQDATGKAPFIAVDYLQALTLGGDERERRAVVGTQAYDLQDLAQRLHTPVVAISSIARTGYSQKAVRESDNPLDFLALAKEAGEIEYAATNVLHLDVRAERSEDGWRAARFIVCKSRFGDLGIVGLRFHGASGRFEPDPAAGLTELQREVFDAVCAGHGSLNDITQNKVVRGRRMAIAEALGVLRNRGLIGGKPLRALQEIEPDA